MAALCCGGGEGGVVRLKPGVCASLGGVGWFLLRPIGPISPFIVFGMFQLTRLFSCRCFCIFGDSRRLSQCAVRLGGVRRNGCFIGAMCTMGGFVRRRVHHRSDVMVCSDVARRSALLETRPRSRPAGKVVTCFEFSLLFRLKYRVYREYWDV